MWNLFHVWLLLGEKPHMPIPPIPPMPPIAPISGIAFSSFGISVTTHSAVVKREATPAASTNAVRTTWKRSL